MGGSVSRFEETNWGQVDGGVMDEKTVDKAPPTPEYHIYELIKRSISRQREFDILDTFKQLKYSTHGVSGTLAWFDVSVPDEAEEEPQDEVTDEDALPGTTSDQNEDSKDKQESSEEKPDVEETAESKEKEEATGPKLKKVLRVQADLTRRTWTIYRYHHPYFEGQKPATLSTLKDIEPETQLYKVACVTVRPYIALVGHFGPPNSDNFLFGHDDDEEEEQLNDKQTAQSNSVGSLHDDLEFSAHDEEEEEDDEDDIVGQASKIAQRRRTNSDDVHIDLNNMIQEKGENRPKDLSTANSTSTRSTRNRNRSRKKQDAMPKPGAAGTWHDTFNHALTTLGETVLHAQPAVPLTKEEKRQAAYEQALEGVIDLSLPLIQCEAVKHKASASHQTSIVSKEKVIQLLHVDQQQQEANKNGSKDAAAAANSDNPLVQAILDEIKKNPPPPTAEASTTEAASTSEETNETSNTANMVEASIRNIGKSWFGFGKTEDAAEGLKEDNGGTSGKDGDKPQESEEQESKEAEDKNENKEKAEEASESEELPFAVDESEGEGDDMPFAVDSSGEQEKEAEAAPATDTTGNDTKGSDGAEVKEEEEEKHEPLIAFWMWQNTYSVHKMQMHIAQNSDLALHIALSILINNV